MTFRDFDNKAKALNIELLKQELRDVQAEGRSLTTELNDRAQVLHLILNSLTFVSILLLSFFLIDAILSTTTAILSSVSAAVLSSQINKDEFFTRIIEQITRIFFHRKVERILELKRRIGIINNKLFSDQ